MADEKSDDKADNASLKDVEPGRVSGVSGSIDALLH
jgi:hypothetical protein